MLIRVQSTGVYLLRRLLKACHRMLGMLQGGLSRTPGFSGLPTLLPSCAFVCLVPTSLQSTAKSDTFTYLSCTHKEGLATMLTSDFDPAGRRVLQHDMEDEDRFLHAMPARRRSFGMICRDQGSCQTTSSAISSSCPPELLRAHVFSHRRPVSPRPNRENARAIQANQAIKRPKLKAGFFYQIHFTCDFYGSGKMCFCIFI